MKPLYTGSGLPFFRMSCRESLDPRRPVRIGCGSFFDYTEASRAAMLFTRFGFAAHWPGRLTEARRVRRSPPHQTHGLHFRSFVSRQHPPVSHGGGTRSDFQIPDQMRTAGGTPGLFEIPDETILPARRCKGLRLAAALVSLRP